MDLGLAGKTAIVTGGSGVIGQGLVLGYASEGVNVISASRDMTKGAELEETARRLGYPGRVLAVKTDITDRKSVAAMIDTCHREFGPVDILCNNAGGASKPGPFAEMDDETFEWELALNLKGVVYATQAVAGDFEKRGGVIVNIGSNGALLSEAAAFFVNYGSSKGYVHTLTKALAGEWASWGVRVNTVSPGWIVPESADAAGDGSLWKRFGFEAAGTPEQMQTAVEDGTLMNMSTLPIKRLGRPEDVANLALFLSSDKSGYITGQLISVSGGAWML